MKIEPLMTFNTLSVRLSAHVQMCVFQSVPAFASFSVFLNVSSLPSSKILESLSFCVYESFGSF